MISLRMKIIPQIDTYPRLVSFCQTPVGKLVLLAAFAGTLVLNELGSWLMVSAIAAAIAFLPQHRRLLLTLGALYRLIFHHTWLNRDFMRAIANTEGQRTDKIPVQPGVMKDEPV